MMALVRVGAVFAFLAVALGAFGAHALRSRLSEDKLKIYQTGVLYHLVHAVAAVALGMLTAVRPHLHLVADGGWCFLLGVVLFSGSLYLIAADRLRGRWGMVTPVGGLFLLAGWILVALGA